MTERYRERLLVLDTAPAEEPLTLAEAKLYLRVDGTTEDALIAELMVAARKTAELHLKRSIITQRWRLVYDDYVEDTITLPMGPVSSIIRVTKVAADSSTEDVAAALYRLNAPKTHLCFEQLICAYQVEIVYETGYGAAEDTPAAIKQGMLAHLAELYDGRSRSLPIPPAALALYMPYREVVL